MGLGFSPRRRTSFTHQPDARGTPSEEHLMTSSRSTAATLALVATAAIVGLTLLMSGCAVQSNGMTLPSPYYQMNRVQYFPRGPEFPYAREAAEIEAARPER